MLALIATANSARMFFDRGRKPENTQRTHTETRRTFTSLGIKLATSLLSGDSANHCTLSQIEHVNQFCMIRCSHPEGKRPKELKCLSNLEQTCRKLCQVKSAHFKILVETHQVIYRVNLFFHDEKLEGKERVMSYSY